MSLVLEGKFDGYEMMRPLIEREAAFEFRAGKNTVRVAFRKGVWYAKKLVGGKVKASVEVSDAVDVSADTELETGLLKALLEIHGRENFDNRSVPSKVLTEFFRVWAGNSESLSTITVVKEGRNSWIDDEGNFDLS